MQTKENEATEPVNATSTRAKMVEKFDSIQEQVGRAKKAAGTIGSVQGVLVDFLSPIGPITLIATLVFAIATGLSGYFWFGRDRKQLHEGLSGGLLSTEEFNEKVASNKWVSIFSYCLIATAILLFFSVGGAVGKNKKRGLIAGNVTALQSVQNSILGLQKDVKQLKRDVGTLKKAGGLILTPEKSGDYFHNATILAKRGERSQARQSFEKAISFNSKFIDLHMGYQALLKDMEGISGTRKVYNKLKVKYPKNLAVQYGYSLLLEDKAKITALKTIVKQHPGYLPAIAQLSQAYSITSLGNNQTMNEKKLEAMYLAMFKKQNESGRYKSYFLNKETAQTIIDGATRRYKQYTTNGYFKNMLKNPVTLRAQAIGSGTYTLIITVAGGVAKEIWYKLSEDGEFKSTGFMAQKNPMTGVPYPKMYIMTRKLHAGKNTVWVKFKDTKNVMAGPFKKTLEIKSKKQGDADRFVRYIWSNPLMKRIGVSYAAGRFYMTLVFASNAKQFSWLRYSFNRPSLNRTLIRRGRGRNQIRKRSRSGRRTLYIQFQLVSGWKSKVIRYNLKLSRRRGIKFFHPAE